MYRDIHTLQPYIKGTYYQGRIWKNVKLASVI